LPPDNIRGEASRHFAVNDDIANVTSASMIVLHLAMQVYNAWLYMSIHIEPNARANARDAGIAQNNSCKLRVDQAGPRLCGVSLGENLATRS